MTVDKHVTLVSELKNKISKRQLMDISRLEQDMVSENDDAHNDLLAELKQLLKKDTIENFDALRLVMIYALRYEKHPKNQLRTLIQILKNEKDMDNEQIKVYF